MDIRDVLGGSVVLAPMAGGPSTIDFVRAGADAGALGFLAAGYKTADEVRAEMAALGRVPYGVNVFVPGPPAEPPTAYVEQLRSEGFDVAAPTWDDDHWDDKIELLLAEPPPVITFTFGCPDRDVVEALQERTAVGITVTVPEEATIAVAAGASFLCVQGHEAGAHRGTFTNAAVPDARPLPQLLADIRAGTDLPLLAAGGVGTAEDVRALLAAGAIGVQCGTAFLRCPEAGTRQVWKDALADPRYTETVVTRAFSGRPARGLRNRFIDDHPDAPAAYPEINNATRPLRAAGDPESMSLWAGTGWRSAHAEPVAEVLDRLTG
jgi:nitronate monooxygenase